MADPAEVVIVGPDGTEHVFPPGFDPQRAAAIVRQAAVPRSVLDTAKDVAIGAGKGAIHTALDLGQAVSAIPGVGRVTNAIGNALGGVAGQALYGQQAQPATNDAAFQSARSGTAYTNTPQMVGGGLETLGELALPVGEAAKAVPTAAKAGAKFQEVMSAARTLPVDVNGPGQVALRIQELADRGGSMPMAVRKFLGRITNPAGGDLTYEEARDFASNISRLSANEYQRLTPVVAREVANLRVALNDAVAKTAQSAGKLDEYRSAMREYARAMQLRDAISSVAEGAKRSVPYATAAGAGAWLTSRILRMLGGAGE